MKLAAIALLAFSSIAGAGTGVQPVQVKAVSALYDLQQVKMRPGQLVMLDVPQALRASPIDWAAVIHRQDSHDENECGGRSSRDCKPAYTSLEFLDSRGHWNCWGGRGSGPCNSKFAEIRSSGSPETDNLYEWTQHGHIDAETGRRSNEPLYVQAMRVRNLGEDALILHNVLLKVAPPAPSTTRDFIFASGLSFGDFITARGRRYPGNADYGDYGNALRINRLSTPRHREIPGNWQTSRGTLEIPLEEGRALVAIDIATGDMKPVPRGADPEQYRGGAQMNVELVRGGRVIDILMGRENVGDNGVLRGSPSAIGARAQRGDVLRVNAPKGEASVMGIRVSYL